MANYDIPTNPIYDDTIRKLEDTDPASASITFNPLMQQLITNTCAVKKSTDESSEKIDEHTEKINAHSEKINENTTNISANTAQISTNTTQIANLKTTTAPKNHASSATTYGVASTTNYGHVKYGAESGTACQGNDQRLVPVATVLAYTSNTTAYPTGYLLCRGQAVSRTTYSKLFENLGTTYGSGDGSTTFNVPDLQTRMPVGYKSGDADFGLWGKTGGNRQQDLRAMIGNTGSNISTLCYEEVSPIPNHLFRRCISNLTNSAFATFAPDNATMVYRADGEYPSTLQPYITMDYIIKY